MYSRYLIRRPDSGLPRLDDQRHQAQTLASRLGDDDDDDDSDGEGGNEAERSS